jgi:hypothetical protein
MGKLIKEWVKSILTENISKQVVVYAGRFQPFHPGHNAVYEHLVKKFGKDNVYIGTSDKTDNLKSPLNFKEKQSIMTTMFGIPSNKIIQIKNPYAPTEILSKYNKETTAFITVIGDKDSDRLKGKYFKKYDSNNIDTPYETAGYVYIAPSLGGGISGTEVRKLLSVGDEKLRQQNFKKIYGKFNPKVYELITSKLSKLERVMEKFITTIDMKQIITEANTTTFAGADLVDDGPGFFYGDFKSYKKVNDEIAERLGYMVVDYIMGSDYQNTDNTDYPNGPGRYPVSFFPSGVAGMSSPRWGDIYGREITHSKAFQKWKKHITKVSQIVGYKLINFLDAEDAETEQSELNENLNKVIQSEHKIDKRILLLCGGSYGHMAHPFDLELNLTFGDLKTIIRSALQGELKTTTEKTDGYALAVSWRDDKGGLIAARNKGHLKNRGESALDISGIASKFSGRGELTDAYNFAMRDLTSAIKSLSKAQRDKIFQQGKSFMNLEVIYPTSVNVIPYGQALLIFHGTMQYDEDGNAIGEDTQSGRILAGMIKQINQHVQDAYTIQGPPVVELPKNQNLQALQPKYISMLSKLQNEFKLKDTDGVAEYHQAWWERWIEKNSPVTLDNNTKVGLVKRWAFNDKSFRLDTKNLTDNKLLDWAQKVDKQDQQKISKENLMKFEEIFLGVGADVLEFTSSVLVTNPDSAVRAMRARIQNAIGDIRRGGDPKKIEKLKIELKRIQSVGGLDKLVPNEGIVFKYDKDGKVYTMKLTGLFASSNQLLGLMYY